MTRFQDGPARGQNLMLKRTPYYLRVVKGAGLSGRWDALDQPEDEPSGDESIHVYRLAKVNGGCHINAGRGRGGFYTMAEYAAVTPAPSDHEVRHTADWHQWCDQHKPTPEELQLLGIKLTGL